MNNLNNLHQANITKRLNGKLKLSTNFLIFYCALVLKLCWYNFTSYCSNKRNRKHFTTISKNFKALANCLSEASVICGFFELVAKLYATKKPTHRKGEEKGKNGEENLLCGQYSCVWSVTLSPHSQEVLTRAQPASEIFSGPLDSSSPLQSFPWSLKAVKVLHCALCVLG